MSVGLLFSICEHKQVCQNESATNKHNCAHPCTRKVRKRQRGWGGRGGVTGVGTRGGGGGGGGRVPWFLSNSVRAKSMVRSHLVLSALHIGTVTSVLSRVAQQQGVAGWISARRNHRHTLALAVFFFFLSVFHTQIVTRIINWYVTRIVSSTPPLLRRQRFVCWLVA